MSSVERALLIINRTAGTGQSELIAEKLSLLFKEGLVSLKQVQVELVSNHEAARACTARFIRESEGPAVVVAGGGGGTLRAIIEGICGTYDSKPLPGPDRVRVGALRMGSGNVLARQFGVPRDPVAGLRGLLINLKTDRTVRCCVMRCEVLNGLEHSESHYGVTLGGLGQFGRIPSDLARWHARFPGVHKGVARLLGIETLTNVEYAVALLIRSVSCVLSTDTVETVEIHFQSQEERIRLLSGIVMNFPVKALPFKPTLRVEEEAALVYLIPLRGRFTPLLQLVAPQRLIAHARCLRLEKDQRLEIRLTDRDCVEFFLDEDPLTTFGRLSFGVAGSIAFVPGPDYDFDRGTSA